MTKKSERYCFRWELNPSLEHTTCKYGPYKAAVGQNPHSVIWIRIRSRNSKCGLYSVSKCAVFFVYTVWANPNLNGTRITLETRKRHLPGVNFRQGRLCHLHMRMHKSYLEMSIKSLHFSLSLPLSVSLSLPLSLSLSLSPSLSPSHTHTHTYTQIHTARRGQPGCSHAGAICT